MKDYGYLKYPLLMIALGIGLTCSAASQIKYPVQELGNCRDKNACKQYCGVSENYLACTDFGLKNNLISEEAATRAREFVKVLNKEGPGGCKGESACKNYCNNVSNVKECVVFGEKHDLIPADKLTSVKQVVNTLQKDLALPGNCKDTATCNSYCSQKENQEECFRYAENSGLNLIKLEEVFKQAPPEAQGCVKSLISGIKEKAGSGQFKGVNDILSTVQGCLPAGAKIPSGGVMSTDFLKKIEEFYGSNLSPKDLESLKKAQEYYKGTAPEGTVIPSGGNTLNLEDLKKFQEKAQEEYNKLSPEELEYIKKMQEQGQFENAVPIEIPSSGSGMGL